MPVTHARVLLFCTFTFCFDYVPFGCTRSVGFPVTLRQFPFAHYVTLLDYYRTFTAFTLRYARWFTLHGLLPRTARTVTPPLRLIAVVVDYRRCYRARGCARLFPPAFWVTLIPVGCCTPFYALLRSHGYGLLILPVGYLLLRCVGWLVIYRIGYAPVVLPVDSVITLHVSTFYTAFLPHPVTDCVRVLVARVWLLPYTPLRLPARLITPGWLRWITDYTVCPFVDSTLPFAFSFVGLRYVCGLHYCARCGCTRCYVWLRYVCRPFYCVLRFTRGCLRLPRLFCCAARFPVTEHRLLRLPLRFSWFGCLVCGLR